jgi:outer membrane protein OmpA-like peptidoglycan-associated protein
VSGKGPDNPVAPNDIESNKSKNRRVEISIPRAD